MTFAWPGLLSLAVLLPALVWFAWLWDRARRREAYARLGELPLIQRQAATRSPGRRALKAGLLSAAGCALGLALARPQRVGTREIEVRGLDVVVALDASTSMLVADAPPGPSQTAPSTRLAHARAVISALLDALPGDRVGPVVFAAAAAHFPLTEDREVAAQFFSDLNPADLPRGSNVAEALRVAQCLLRRDLAAEAGCAAIGRRGDGGRPLSNSRSQDLPEEPKDDDLIEREERGRVIIVVTDGGEDAQDAPAAIAEVRKARELGIATMFLGVGSEAGGPVPDVDDDGNVGEPRLDERGAPVISRRGDPQLRELAAAAGDASRYLLADDAASPGPILRALEQVSRGLATRKSKEKRDVFPPFVFAAFMLLLIEAAISTRRRAAPDEP
ncbi:MAG: VWA domain-containing protein [Kofleriaceae bacterium]